MGMSGRERKKERESQFRERDASYSHSPTHKCAGDAKCATLKRHMMECPSKIRDEFKDAREEDRWVGG